MHGCKVHSSNMNPPWPSFWKTHLHAALQFVHEAQQRAAHARRARADAVELHGLGARCALATVQQARRQDGRAPGRMEAGL